LQSGQKRYNIKTKKIRTDIAFGIAADVTFFIKGYIGFFVEIATDPTPKNHILSAEAPVDASFFVEISRLPARCNIL
jgi:hypothetical protein